MARVEANAEPRMAGERLVERGQLLEGATDRAARAGRVLHAQPRRLVAPFERLGEGGDDALQRGIEATAQMRADVEDDRLGADRAGSVHGRTQGRHALLVEVLL